MGPEQGQAERAAPLPAGGRDGGDGGLHLGAGGHPPAIL